MQLLDRDYLATRLQPTFTRDSLVEWVICLSLLLFSSTLGMTYVAVWGDGADYYQREYGPAVMIAAGNGFVNPVSGTVPGLDEFLEGRSQSLALSDIPSEVATEPLTQLQARWRYLLYTSGLLWKFFGISWQALLPLFGAMFAVSGLALYALFRSVCGRSLSLLGTLLCILSPFNLYYLAFLRDYSKVPFIIATIAALAYLVSRNFSWRNRYVLIALLGATLGIGLGFRKDVVICIPPTVVVLAIFIPGSLRQDWRRRAFAIALLIVAFLTTGFPLLGAMREKGGTTSHVLILGLMEPFEKAMGVGNTPYAFGPIYRDPYAYSLAKDFAQQGGVTEEILYGTPEYDEICADTYRWVAGNFPADMLTRWYAAAIRILNYGPYFTEAPDEEWNPNTFVHRLFSLRWKYLGFLSGKGVLVCATLAIILSTRCIRFGLSYLFLMLYFTGYSSLQFSQRHFFHLECALWWSLVALLSIVWCAVQSWRIARSAQNPPRRPREKIMGLRPHAIRIGTVALVSACTVVLPLVIARMYQAGIARQLYDRYQKTELVPVASQAFENEGTAWVSFDIGEEGFASADPDFVRSSYFAIDFELDRPVTFWPRYEARTTFNDFTHRVELSPNKGDARLIRYFLPVFEASESSTWGGREFRGFLIERDLLPCVRGVYTVRDRAAFPVLLPMTLRPGEQALPAYATITTNPLPFYPRARFAHKHNEFPNGNLELWSSIDTLESFDYPPETIRVERDYTLSTNGQQSARVSWEHPPGPTSVNARFRTEPIELESGSEYELFVDCFNPSANAVSISGWQLSDTGAGGIEFVRLTPSVISFETNDGFVTKAGRFVTVGESRASIVLAVAMQGGSYPAHINLDNFRLMKVR